MTGRDPKVCVACGRAIEWRKKWERDWERVHYCSKSCRSRRVSPEGEALESTMLSLLRERGASKSICPSEAARFVSPDDWQGRMEPARRAARRLVARGLAQITQGGRVVDPSACRGPIRVRLVNGE